MCIGSCPFLFLCKKDPRTLASAWRVLQVLESTLPALLWRVKPELVCYNAGVDVHRDDSLGKLALTDRGIAARNCFVPASAQTPASQLRRPLAGATRRIMPPL